MTQQHDAAGSSWRERASWCLFDFANSAFVTIMITALYGRYFMEAIARDTSMRIGPIVLGPNSLWAFAISSSMAMVAISSPILGALADRTGRKRTLLRSYVMVNVLACGALGFVVPGTPLAVPLALVLIVVANIAFEGAYVFYNAFLPELAKADHIGRLSGYGWAVGYVGGLGCLALIKIAGWVPADFAHDPEHEALRIPLAVAAWFLVFSLPMLTIVRERQRPLGKPEHGFARQAFVDVRGSFSLLRHSRDLLLFFIAYLLFTDALETVIIFTGKFTGDVLRFTPQDTLTLFLVLNVIAAPGAVAFGFIVDKLGGVRGVALSLVLWLLVIVGSVFVQTKAQFWPVAAVAAVALGATQSASRAVVARLVPAAHTTRVFGMMTVVGRASAIVGPMVYGVVSDTTGNPRIAVATVGVFLLAGLVILTRVNEARGREAAGQADWSVR